MNIGSRRSESRPCFACSRAAERTAGSERVGIGANYISPIYRTESKRFSTAFNFGDHAAVGRILGDHRQASVALRLQHFSNGGIDEPNPGENFTQLRYSYQF